MNAKQLSSSFVGIILLLALSSGARAESPTKSSASPDRVAASISLIFSYVDTGA